MKNKPKLITDSLPLKIELDELVEKDGHIEVPVIVQREMVYDYGNTKAFKPKAEIEKAAQYADSIPITRGHPESGIVTDQSEILGFFKSPVMEDTELAGILQITDKSLIADVKAGNLKEVSGGFFCDLNRDMTGEYDGTKYDATQTNIVMNHVAVVKDGRCSLEDGCGIQLDEQTEVKKDAPADLRGKLDTAIGMAESLYESRLGDLLKEIKEMLGTENKLDDAKTEDAKADSELNTKLSEAVLALKTDNAKIKAELDAIQRIEKDTLIAELTAAQDTKPKELLEKLSIDELKTELAMVNGITATRLAGPEQTKGRISIDNAYAKIGEKAK